MNSNLAPESETSASPALRTGAIWKWLPVLIILIAAVSYYGSYLQYWFNPHDEGGFACLIGQRLMNGERPWVDVETGYNIGWFYPIIALFKITGVNYLAARAWFFVLATITALFGYSVVSRVSGSRLAGLAVGLLLVMLPGSQFKGYIQFAQAANAACLIFFAFQDPKQKRKWLGAACLGGIVLGITYLLRVELGFFYTTIWVLLLLVFLLDRRLPALGRLAGLPAALIALAGGVVIAQFPAYMDLKGRNLEPQYWAEYTNWYGFLRASVEEKISDIKHHRPARTPNAPEGAKAAPEIAPAAPALAAEPAPVATPEVDPSAPNPAPPAAAANTPVATTMHDAANVDRSILPRKAPSEMWRGAWRDRQLPFLTYAPFVGFGIFFVFGLIGFLRDIFRSDFNLTSRSLLWLLLVGASLTTFPQFFFFRPDRPHLSEFMTGHITAMAACLWLIWPRGESRPLAGRLFAWGIAGFLALQLTVYTAFAMKHASSGTIAARIQGDGRKAWFHGENGVHVREFKRDAASLKGVYDAVMKATGPDDYVICYPYMPGYNVMTNRPTYLQNVYVDNATHSSNWSEEAIRRFEDKKPAVVIIDDRAINGTEGSRFSKWAPKVVEYLKANYTLAGKFETVEVFTRPKPAAQPQEPVQN